MKTIVTYKGHEVACYGKLRQDSEIIYALSDGCEGVTDNFNYETTESFLDWDFTPTERQTMLIADFLYGDTAIESKGLTIRKEHEDQTD